MKCAILAFDALEYRFVQKYALDALKQQEFGKVRIPPGCYIKVNPDYASGNLMEAQTPRVWFSFLTGKSPDEVGFRPLQWRNRVLNSISTRLWRCVSPENALGIKLPRLMDKIFSFLKIEQRRSEIQDFKLPTIFDLTKKSFAINVPLYTKNWWGWGYNVNLDDFNNLNDFINTVLDKQMAKFNEQIDETLKFLERNNDWDLFMAYYYILDPYGELCFDDETKLREIYVKVDNFVEDIKIKLDESFVLIISDHGIERLEKTSFGKHSDYAFYSANLRLGLKNPCITDFYQLAKKMLAINKPFLY